MEESVPQTKTQALLLIPPMVEEVKDRLENVEKDSVATKIFMAKIDLQMESQGKILEKIDRRMEIGDTKFSEIEKRFVSIETDAATTKAGWETTKSAWTSTGKGIAFFLTIAGSVGAAITWVMTHFKIQIK